MKSDQTVAKRYAKALFDVARNQGVAEQVGSGLQMFVSTLRSQLELRKFVQHPNLKAQDKLDLVKKAFQGQLPEVLENTLGLLFERGREKSIPTLYEAYVKIADEALGQAEAVVSTPYPLSEQESQTIAEQFGKLTGKKIRIEQRIDRRLLGGFRLQLGGRLYDASLSSKLARLEKSLQQSQAL